MQRQRKLIALNLGLLALLALVTLAPTGAEAQSSSSRAQPSQPRARGTYTIVAGETSGQSAATLYILDSTNQELVAIEYQQSRDNLKLVGYRNLAEDARRQNQQR